MTLPIYESSGSLKHGDCWLVPLSSGQMASSGEFIDGQVLEFQWEVDSMAVPTVVPTFCIFCPNAGIEDEVIWSPLLIWVFGGTTILRGTLPVKATSVASWWSSSRSFIPIVVYERVETIPIMWELYEVEQEMTFSFSLGSAQRRSPFCSKELPWGFRLFGPTLYHSAKSIAVPVVAIYRATLELSV